MRNSLWRIRHLGRIQRIRNGAGAAGGGSSPTGLQIDLLADWPFDEAVATSDRVDEVAGYLLVPGASGSVGVVPGVIDLAVRIDGAAEETLSNTTPSLRFSSDDPFTIEWWLKDAGPTGFFDFVLGQQDSIRFYNTSSGDVGLLMGDVNLSFGYSVGIWNQVVATYDGTTASLYVNGTFRSGQDNTTPFAASTAPLELGNSSIDAPFSADNLRYWSYALAADPINWLWNGGASRTYAELADYTPEVVPLEFGIIGQNFLSPVPYFST